MSDEAPHDFQIRAKHAIGAGLPAFARGGTGKPALKSSCLGLLVAGDVVGGSEMIRVLTEIQTVTTTGVGAEMALIIQITDETVNDWKMLAHF
jgi:hypothetical protein